MLTRMALRTSSCGTLSLSCPMRGEPLRQRHLEPCSRPRRIVEIRNRHARERSAERPLDGSQLVPLLGRHERERLAGGFGPAGAADTVHVVVGDEGDVEVDDMPEGIHVDATGRDIRRDQDRRPATLESGKR